MFRFNQASPVTFQDPLPEAVGVAVIGGGVIGIYSALTLRQRGLSVLVCDKGVVAGKYELDTRMLGAEEVNRMVGAPDQPFEVNNDKFHSPPRACTSISGTWSTRRANCGTSAATTRASISTRTTSTPLSR